MAATDPVEVDLAGLPIKPTRATAHVPNIRKRPSPMLLGKPRFDRSSIEAKA